MHHAIDAFQLVGLTWVWLWFAVKCGIADFVRVLLAYIAS